MRPLLREKCSCWAGPPRASVSTLSASVFYGFPDGGWRGRYERLSSTRCDASEALAVTVLEVRITLIADLSRTYPSSRRACRIRHKGRSGGPEQLGRNVGTTWGFRSRSFLGRILRKSIENVHEIFEFRPTFSAPQSRISRGALRSGFKDMLYIAQHVGCENKGSFARVAR